jgi:outer membrane biosynthesis protein TonB
MSFETFLTQQQARPKKGRRLTYAMSLLLHGVALSLAAAVSYWHVEELSPPNIPLFISGGPLVPPPPPKGSPEPRRRRRPTTVAQPRSKQTLQPQEAPEPEETDDRPGVRNGDEAGHPEGINPGNPPADPPPPPEVFIPPKVATGRLAIDPNDDRYAARLPAAMARVGASLWALVKICVHPDGMVNEVKIIRGADPTVDPLIVAAIQRWRYHPYTVDGRPVPFCTNVRYEISTR